MIKISDDQIEKVKNKINWINECLDMAEMSHDEYGMRNIDDPKAVYLITLLLFPAEGSK